MKDGDGEVDSLEGSASRLFDCPPPMAWDELEPWEQRNPRNPWMMRRGRGGSSDTRNGEPRRTETSVSYKAEVSSTEIYGT